MVALYKHVSLKGLCQVEWHYEYLPHDSDRKEGFILITYPT